MAARPPVAGSRGELPSHVVDGLPMPVVLSRASDDVVVRINGEYTAAYGVEPDAALGRSVRELHYAQEDRDRTLTHYRAGDLTSVEVRIRTADDECRWAQADVALFDFEGDSVLVTTLYDIEAKKEAEKEVESGQARITEMARFPEMNPGPVARLELDGTVRRANSAANRVFGLDTLEGECFWDLAPALDESVQARIAEGGEPVRRDVRVGDAWLSLTLAFEPSSGQIFVFGTDITAQKTAERELLERARFPQMNPGPVARLKADGTVLRANPAAGGVFGLEDIRGQSFRELCGGIPDDTWRRILDEGRPVQHEAEVAGLNYSFTLVHEPESDQVFVYGSDVTELKAAERLLAELARFPEMNPGPVLRLDRQGVVLLANPAARTVFAGEDPAGRSWLEICPGVDQAFWAGVCSATRAVPLEARIGDRHFIFHHAPGPEGLLVFVYGSDITDEKKAEQALLQSEKMATLGTLAAGVAHELNNPAAAAQRAAEQMEVIFGALQRSQQTIRGLALTEAQGRLLEELDQEAHETACTVCVLDPLERSDREMEVEEWLDERSVDDPWEVAPALVDLGYGRDQLDALIERGAGEHAMSIVVWQARTHGVYRLLEEIRHGSGRLVEIVGAMKSYAYLGQAPVQNVDVNEGLRSTLVILRSKLKQGVRVTQDFDPDLPRIHAYGSELNQVWTNILDNAVHAMGGEGDITIRTFRRDDDVIVEIEDDGPGILPEHRSRIFDAFFTTKPPGEGTGLGLNTSYNIVVEKHGGSIDLESEPGRTCFFVSLPMTRGDVAGGDTPEQDDSRSG